MTDLWKGPLRELHLDGSTVIDHDDGGDGPQKLRVGEWSQGIF